MIDTHRALLEQALEHLDEATAYTSSPSWSPSMTQEILDFCAKARAELAKPVEPVESLAWMGARKLYRPRVFAITNDEQVIEPLYLYPPAPSWHDAPAEPGLWINDGCSRITVDANHLPPPDGRRWYGPIPMDDKKGSAV